MEIANNILLYRGYVNSTYVKFSCFGVREMLDFLRNQKTIDGEKIRSFNFSYMEAVNVHNIIYNCGDVIAKMKELKDKYGVSSNNIFREDVKNLIELLEDYLSTREVAIIINVIKKIKQAMKGE